MFARVTSPLVVKDPRLLFARALTRQILSAQGGAAAAQNPPVQAHAGPAAAPQVKNVWFLAFSFRALTLSLRQTELEETKQELRDVKTELADVKAQLKKEGLSEKQTERLEKKEEQLREEKNLLLAKEKRLETHQQQATAPAGARAH